MHDDQFTAKGPPFSGSGFPQTAFSTNQDGGGFQFGVRVNASRCGVVGQTGQGGIAGVCGQGRFSQFGVLGTAFQNRTGVVGVSVDNTNDLFNLNTHPGEFNLGSLGGGQGTGVLGKSGAGVGVHGISATSTGVFGSSGTGFGLHGISDTTTAVVGSSRAGFGVHGLSTSNSAVVGTSEGGDGIVGQSSTGQGGRFESGRAGSIAGQIRLVPQPMPVTNLVPTTPAVYDIGVLDLLPSQGQGGEMLVTQADDGNCVLWMCTRSSTPSERATWRQVLLGQPVAAPAPLDTEFVDWQQVTGDRATGAIFGGAVTLDGPIGTGSSTDAMFREYDTESFEPRLIASDCVEIVGRAEHTFTLTFATPVQNPILMLASLGSLITFAPETAVTRVSGDDGFVVDGSAVKVAGPLDVGGVVRLEGTFTAITFSAVTSVGPPEVPDGIFLQVGASRPG